MIQISKTAISFLKNEGSVKKASFTKVEGFQMSPFDWKQTYKIAFKEKR